MKVVLSTPVQAHGKEVAELELRAPTGKDLRECGLPFYNFVDDEGHTCTRIDTASVAKYIKNLAEIPPSSVDCLSPADFLALTEAVTDFFPKAAASPPPP